MNCKKNLKCRKRNDNIERNNKKQFCENLETLFDLAAKKAEPHISGNRLRIEKAKKEDLAFLRDQRNARKKQIFTLNHKSKEKWQRKHQKVEAETSKYYKLYLAKQISLPQNHLFAKLPLSFRI